jgi:hypothetical protein
MIQQDTIKAVIADSLQNDSTALVDSLQKKDSLSQHIDTVIEVIEKRFDGILHPSFPQTENWVFVVLLVLFLLLMYSIVRSHGWLLESIRTFFQVKERSSIFSTAAVNNFQSKALLQIFSTGVLSLYVYLAFWTPPAAFSVVIWLKFLVVTAVFLFLKYVSFRLLGYVFFDNKTMKHAETAYFNILFYLGIVIFPLLILEVYTSSVIQSFIPLVVLFVSILGAILVIIKLFQIFFHKIVAIFYILLYLCTLEILPLIILFSVYKLLML